MSLPGAVGPGLGGVPKILDVEHQTCSCWCWAAVAVSIAKFFYPTVAASWSQGKLAYQTYHERDSQCTLSLDDCCNNPCSDAAHEACDLLIEPDGVILPLQLARVAGANLQMTSVSAATDQAILASLRQGLPVCATINWRADGFHFVAIVGAEMRSGVQFYYVSDPRDGLNILSRDQLETAYRGTDDASGGSWAGAYFTSRQP